MLAYVTVLACIGALHPATVAYILTDPTQLVSSYVTYLPGDMNVVLTSSHGGSLTPSTIPDRDAGCWVNGKCEWSHTCTDKNITRCRASVEPCDNTYKLTMKLRENIFTFTGRYPHVIISNLKRFKMDANRNKDEATFGVPEAELAWEMYHGAINVSKATFMDKPGLVIDIHGHTHSTVRTELGYLISGTDLDSNNYDLRTSSISYLASRVVAGNSVSANALLQGEQSLGAMLEQEGGYKAVPSPSYQGPSSSNYFSGLTGNTLKMHGSKDGGKIDAIMVTSARSYLNADTTLDAYTSSLAKALKEFLTRYYDLESLETTSAKLLNTEFYFLDQTSGEPTPYVTYLPGDLNLILTAPHGGYLTPVSIPDRDYGCWIDDKCVWSHECTPKDNERCEATTVSDDNSLALTIGVREGIYKLTGRYPHVVISNLKRTKLDANRGRDQAAFGVPEAIVAWEKYHGAVNVSKQMFRGKPGLVIDIHGQSHAITRTEVGYLISGSELDANTFDASISSIHHLASRVNISFEELLRGDKSFGGMLELNGFHAVPSPFYPGPGGVEYFSGRGLYTLETHGSKVGGNVDAIMAESAWEYRKAENLENYARSLSKTIVQYMTEYYGTSTRPTDDVTSMIKSTSYLTYLPGDLNLILTAPHGGYLTPSSIPDRDAGCWVAGRCIWSHDCGVKDFDRCPANTVPDDKMYEVILGIRRRIYEMTGHFPHVIICNLKRTKIDANRNKDEATFGVPEAELAWEMYHGAVRLSKKMFAGQTGLYIDIHGQGHEITRSEIGYLISGDDLDNNKTFDPTLSSIRHLASRIDVDFEELLRGEQSLGGMMEREGFHAVPSPFYPGPGGALYFSGLGLYSTVAHGSKDEGNIDAILIESASPYRKDAVIDQYVTSLSKVIFEYMDMYYGFWVSDGKTKKALTLVVDDNSGSILHGRGSAAGIMTICCVIVYTLLETVIMHRYK